MAVQTIRPIVPKGALIVVTAVGFLVIGGITAFRAYAGPREGAIPAGVRVAGMDWGNKASATARAELRGWSQAKLADAVPLTVTLPSGRTKKWSPSRAVLGLEVDVEATVRKAETARKDETVWNQVAAWVSEPRPVDLKPVWSLSEEKLRAYLQKRVAPAVLRPGKDARFLVTGDTFQIRPEVAGVKLDLEKAVEAVKTSVDGESGGPVELPIATAMPRVTAADLEGIEGEIGRFQTHYGERGNRMRNIATACRKIDGVVLKPGDIFSYNKVVGPRDSAAGYRLAPVIVRGRLEPGLGGGICQTSSTLYNAILLSGLKIVRRNHHAFPVHYVPAGRDATVAYGSVDFKFQNDTDYPVAISASGGGGRVLMRIFGKKVPGRTVRIERSHISSWGAPVQTVTDRSLRAGSRRVIDKGHSGHRVKVWRIVKSNGEVVKRELVSSDHYRAFPRVVAVGSAPGAVSAKAPAPLQRQASPAPAASSSSPAPPRATDSSSASAMDN